MLDWQCIIKEETEKCRVTTFPTADGKSTYPYVILPFESRFPAIYLKSVITGMKVMLKDELKEATTIVLPEAKGFLLSPLSEATGLDVTLVRKRDYRIPGQLVIKQTKIYKDKEGENLMFCVGLKKDDKPLIVDDIFSSGGSAISIGKSFEEYGYEIVGFGAVYERGNGMENVEKETGYTAKGLARLEVVDKELPGGKIVKIPYVPRVLNAKF
jgi:adenine/guanine phosphoribosyltransferase-like PRPP-binding protein